MTYEHTVTMLQSIRIDSSKEENQSQKLKGRSMEQFYSDPSRAADPFHLPDCIVFETPDGWFWQSQMPGCLPDSDPIGPFDSRQEAIDDCQDIG